MFSCVTIEPVSAAGKGLGQASPSSRGNFYSFILRAEARTVSGKPVNREAHEKNSGPRHNTADEFWIAGTEQPAQIFRLIIAENPDRFDADDPAGMEAHR